MPNTYDFRTITIGNKSHWSIWVILFFPLYPIIVVFYYHQHITRRQFVFSVENTVTDTLIINISALIATSNHHSLIYPYIRITSSQLLYEFTTRYHLDISKSLKTDFRQFCRFSINYHLSDNRSII